MFYLGQKYDFLSKKWLFFVFFYIFYTYIF